MKTHASSPSTSGKTYEKTSLIQTRPQEFDVGLAFNHWKRDGRPERLEFSFPGLIVLYSFLGFNLQDESIFRTSHAVKPGKDVTSHRMPHPSLWSIQSRKVHGRLNASWKISSLAVNGQSFLVIDGYLLNPEPRMMD